MDEHVRMARPREFDHDEVLNAAMLHFWQFGFESTSIKDLAAEMGMSVASIYNAFGDKRALFLRVLEHYVDSSFEDRLSRIEGNLAPRAAIEAFFKEIVERSLQDPARKGCMLINSALEMAPHDEEFRQVVSLVLARVESFFHRCIQAGQTDGTIDPTLPARDMARLLIAVHIGIRVMARSRPERAQLEGMLRPALAFLKPSR
jgi:TetR/AcrR family transcriptional repressor of nem operon